MNETLLFLALVAMLLAVVGVARRNRPELKLRPIRVSSRHQNRRSR